MLGSFKGINPIISKKSYIAEGSAVIGDVVMEDYSSVWYNCVLRGDVNKIVIGKYSNIQDGTVVHCADNYGTIVGDFVVVGHNVTLHGATIEDHCLIGMGSVVLNNAFIGRGSIVAAGAVVKENMVIPPFSLVAGVPAKVIKTLEESTIETIHSQALKYKSLWSVEYGVLPELDGER